jgi:hypothetical protein
MGNSVYMATTGQVPTSHQICIKYDASTQDKMVGNNCSGGWRGITTEASGTGSLNNTQYSNNRIVSSIGACFAVGGAGAFIDGNYCNHSNGPAAPVGVCDGACTNKGIQCLADADCGTCTNSINKCIPEPIFAFIGAPGGAAGASTAHNTYAKNVVFANASGTKQCTATGPIGQVCTVAAANGSCNAGATCSGTPAVCAAGGTETGKLCCTTTGTGACGARTRTPYMRVMDYGAPTSHLLLNIALNSFFPGPVSVDNLTGIDFLSATTADLTVLDSQFDANLFIGDDGGTSTNSEAIRFPTNFVSITHMDVANNLFDQWPTPASTGNILNYQGSFGSLLLRNGDMFNGSGTALRATAGNDFFPLNGTAVAGAENTVNTYVTTAASTFWKLACSITVTPGVGNTRTFLLRDNSTTSSAMTCVITGNGPVTCTPAAGATSAPFAVAAGHTVDVLDTAAGTPAAATGSCVVYGSIDSYF